MASDWIRSVLWVLVTVAVGSCGESKPSKSGQDRELPWLTDRTTSVGLGEITHRAELKGHFATHEIMGSGLALIDTDGDGDLDLYVLQGGREPGDGAPNELWLFDQGQFHRATETGLEDAGYGTGVAVGDLDNDGDLDVFVGNHGPDALYLNDGHGHFENVTSRAGIAGNDWSTSVAMLDYDLDGWLDIFVVHYLVEDPERNCIVAGRTDYCGPAVFPGRADRLWRNLGDGRFEDVSESTGIARIVAHGLGVVIEDFNGDGWPDLYVANDQDANQLWMNTKKGGFRDDALVFGAAFNGMGAVEASMGVTAGDVDGDGYIDLFMTHFAGQTNTLYRGSADGVFGDDSSSSGLGTPSLAYTGFGTQFGDLDNDGDLDLAVVNGRVVRAEKPIEADDEFVSNYAEPAQLFENVRGKFFDLGGKAGEFASQPGVGRSLALVDVDGDGGLDVFVTRCRGPLRFYRNVHPARGHWLCVRAFDPALNRDAYGALITLVTASGQQARRVSPAVSYQTSGTIDLHFGMGEATEYSALLVQWPGGATERFPGGPADRTVLLRRGEGR